MDAPGKPRLCSLVRGSDGYGFNLHGEKGQHGQYIRAVDEGSAAQLAGLCTGDRVIEVNGTNIERETHTQVVSRIKAGGSSTILLVVDKELDRYCRNNSITIKASMADGGVGEDSPRVNGDHLESEGMVPMNGDASGMGGHEVIEASIEEHQESAPERQEEEEEDEHPYAEVERRQEQEDEDEVDEQFAAVLAGATIEDGERREVEEDDVVQAEEVTMEESVPGPPMDRDEDSDVSLPEPEPEPILEAATVPVVESAPPVADTETDYPGYTEEPEPEPEREPTPEPEREPTPEPVREPTPEPVREPTPEPVREPTPEPVRQPTPEPVVHKPTRTESVPPSRPTAPPTSRQASLNVDSNKSSMEKARILAAGRKKKKQASSKNWEDKYAAFNQL
ncbi:Na(+)/H(+) exchange regulatory cofactor NHE-RF1-like isoform X1 [Strongylocentrotus purpuratus]|uniref:PDZ domain-containing protein n=1 Tax=Strongylocentrotus purpuratus TaxID=7668 RepID=A0A7M7NIP3_STRPU|nr:Na(+)/H(+) exchange regulatory cofactor NHE-RF1-like isoform X1 [Strongylocentrotus purpuratus]